MVDSKFMNKLRQSQEVLSRKLDGEWVLLNLCNGQYYGLNQMGSFIWDTLQKPQDKEQVLQDLIKNYECDQKTAARELQSFFNDLSREGLIEIEPSPKKA
jgi:hypothetical protein